MNLHPNLRAQRLTIGAEGAPLLVVDDFVADPDSLVADAVAQSFTERSPYYPGIRAKAPQSYQQLLVTGLRSALLECLAADSGTLSLSMCHYSLVTTPAGELAAPQRIPHVDSLARNGLASIHYLFKRNLGGTAFYRHRKTGFEYVDEARNETYLKALRSETMTPAALGPGYINGDTDLFEQIAKQDGAFNRLLIYRRNSLHSGCIARDFVPDSNPLSGRLSINAFIDLTA